MSCSVIVLMVVVLVSCGSVFIRVTIVISDTFAEEA